MERRSLMIILAHPDDESLPVGGTIAKYAASGASVTLIAATAGQPGAAGRAFWEGAALREGELRAAAGVLGAVEVRVLGYADGTLDQACQDEVRRRLRALILTHRPDAVITFGPEGLSGHPDHLAIHRLATEAFDAAALPGARLYYIASAAAQGGAVAAIDVGAFREAKARASACHPGSHPFGDEAEEAMRLADREYFALARPAAPAAALGCLFEPLPGQSAA